MAEFAASMDNAAENLEGATRALAHLFKGGIATGMAVSQHAGGANMSVDIAAGDIFLPKTDYGPWAWSTAVKTVTIGAASAQDRHDAIVAWIDFSVSNPSTSTPNNPGALKFSVVPGTPSGTPVDPSGATIQAAIGAGNPYKLIASVLVLSTDTNIVTGRITNYTVPVALAVAYLYGGNLNTIGHLLPNAADDTILLAALAQTISGVKTFTADPIMNDGALNLSFLKDSSDRIADYVRSGTGAIAQNAGLVGTFANITYYIAGKRYTKTSITNKTYTASRDTYVDIDTSGTITYVEVSNGATAPALTANSIRVAKVITNGSAITSVVQAGSDSIGNPIFNTSALSTGILHNPRKFSVYRSAAFSLPGASATTKIAFDTEEYDSGGNFDSTTNFCYTASVAEFLRVSAGVGVLTGGAWTFNLLLYKNGALYKNLGQVKTNSANTSLCGGTPVQLAAGDYLEIFCFSNDAGANNLNVGQSSVWFAGELISHT